MLESILKWKSVEKDVSNDAPTKFTKLYDGDRGIEDLHDNDAD